MSTLYFSSSFKPNQLGHGGSQRSSQIHELLARADLSMTDLGPRQASFGRKLIELTYLTCSSLGSLCRSGRWRHVRQTWDAHRMLDRHEVALIVSEKFLANSEYVTSGRPSIVVPQNIEGYVPGLDRASQDAAIKKIRLECALIGQAFACFCICEEDLTIANMFCPRSLLLPYYPPSHQFDILLKIREMRLSRGNFNGPVLVLGSALNPPTMIGMSELLNHLESAGVPTDREIVIAGFGTESLDAAKFPRVRLMGAVSQQVLHDLMCQARCVLINHSATTGSLTRVADCLVAGVPVVANRFGLRGYTTARGVTSYRLIADGLQAAFHASLEMPDIPERPVFFEDQFISTVSRFFNSH